jgi:PAS domain S-box-containing protein
VRSPLRPSAASSDHVSSISDEQLRFLSENLAEGMVYQIDSGLDGNDRVFSYLSPAVQRLHGLAVEEVLANPDLIYAQLLPEDRDRLILEEERAFATRTLLDIDVRVRLPSGEVRWRHFRSAPRLRSDGHIVWDGIEIDITERKQAEETARRLAEEGLAIQRLARISNYRWDIPTDQLTWGPVFFEIAERPPHDFPRTMEGFVQLIHPDDRQRFRQALDAILAGHPIRSIEYRLALPQGGYKHIITHSTVEFAADGQTPRVLSGYAQDISDLKRAQLEKDHLQAELAQAQKLESVGRLAGGVAHDFNNMLGVILGRAELLLKDLPDPSPLRHGLEQIQTAARRSAELTRQLLTFARRQAVAPRVINLNEAVSGMLKMLRRLIGEDIRLAWSPDPDLWHVCVDLSQLDQILTNLCVNARDAIGGNGTIEIVTRNVTLDAAFCATKVGLTPCRYVMLAVADTGQGIPPEVLPHVFEPFFTTKMPGQGTGLGLATVYGIVRQNGGFLDVTSQPGQGTTFRIYLPRVLKPSPDLQPEPPLDPPRARAGETILLVEDEPGILEVGRIMLESLGYQVLAARTPADALQIIKDRHPSTIHLLVTDVVMPQMNGRELGERLAAAIPGLPHLFMSGYTADIVAHRGIDDQRHHFLAKPFSLESLATKVRQILDQTPRPDASA